MQLFAHVVDGSVREIVSLPDGVVPGRDLYTPAFAAELVSCDAGVRVGWLHVTGAFSAPPAPVDPVPAEITAAQAEIQLLRAGLRDRAMAAVTAAGGEAEIWFLRARVWERSNPYVVAIGTALDLTDAAVDDLFRQAHLIQG